MNESSLSSSTVPGIEPGKRTLSVGAGALLRAAREAQGLHIAMLAVSLKVPVKKLEALEADHYDLLPDIVFARALACSVCRALKIDAAPVLAALPRSDFPRIKTDEQGLNTTFNETVSGAGQNLQAQLTKPLGMAVLLLLAGILVITFFPSKTVSELVSIAPADDTAAAIQVPPAVGNAVALPALAPQLPVSSEALTLSNSMNGTRLGDTVNPASVPMWGASATLTSPGSVASLGSESDLTLHANESSWVEVVDAQGVLHLRKTLVKDETVPVTGVLPLTVVVGRADAVSVAIRGRPFDTAPVSKNNVARFEVK